MEKVVNTLNKLKGHRTYIFVVVCTIPILIKIMFMSGQEFLDALSTFMDYLVGVAAVLLGSKIGDAMNNRWGYNEYCPPYVPYGTPKQNDDVPLP